MTLPARSRHTFAATIDGVPPWLTVERRRAIAVALLGAVVLIVAARHLAGARAPSAANARAAAAALVTAPAPSKILVVHVVGAVRRPGLYHFPDGSRVADAVRRAGGATRRADLSQINLAAPIADGLQVAVPRREPRGVGLGAGGEAPAGPVHLNTATLEELDTLPGVGPVTAQKILDYRQQNGGFTSLDDLDAVPGIGPARLESLRDVAAP